MSSTSEKETEILLGNRHLLAIFFVLAILLGIAFTGGYMVGRNSSDKKIASLAAATTDPAASTNGGAASPGTPTSMETHSLPPAGSEQADTSDQTHTLQPPAPLDAAAKDAKDELPLGAPKQEPRLPKAPPAPPDAPAEASCIAPESGQCFFRTAKRTNVFASRGRGAHGSGGSGRGLEQEGLSGTCRPETGIGRNLSRADWTHARYK